MRMLAVAAVCAALAGLWGTSVEAAEAAPPAAAAPAHQAMDQKHILARQLVGEMGFETSMGALQKSLMAQMTGPMAQLLPAEPAKRDALMAYMNEQLAADTPRIADVLEESYAHNFTERELRDILTFNQTPSGRSYLAKRSLITSDLAAAEGPMLLELERNIMLKGCDLYDCPATDRAAIIKAFTDPPVS